MAGSRRGNDRSRGGYAHITYRLQAVRFSLFRHPPRGGSADATFPRWGKEGGLRIHPGICWKPGAAARRVGDAAPYKVNADSPDGLLRYCTAARNAEDGVPYRACADLPKVEANLCRVLRGPGHGLDAGPYRGAHAYRLLSPPNPHRAAAARRGFFSSGLLRLGAFSISTFHCLVMLWGSSVGGGGGGGVGAGVGAGVGSGVGSGV